MSGGVPPGALRDLETLFGGGRLGGMTDGQLLQRFASRDDRSGEDAFAILFERHAPMVWGVCRRLLADPHDAADALQATFLVLVRRASAIRVDDSLGPWLHGVSRRVASRARTTSLRRAARETGGVEALAGPGPEPGDAERLAILDEEIGRLPERYRAALILCDLEGLPHQEAARRLGCPVGTVASRLSRGRRRLRDRLVRRGVAPAAAALWAESARRASAAMPAVIARSASSVASLPAAGAVPAAYALAEGVIRMMWFAKLKPLAAVAAALILATAGVAVQGRQQPAPGGDRAGSRPATAPPAAAAGDDAPPNRELAKEQLALIDEAEAELQGLAKTANIRLADPSFALWARRRVEALRASGAGKAEAVAALEKYVARMNEAEAVALKEHRAGQLTGVELREVKFRRREAQMWLNDERAR